MEHVNRYVVRRKMALLKIRMDADKPAREMTEDDMAACKMCAQANGIHCPMFHGFEKTTTIPISCPVLNEEDDWYSYMII